MPVPRFSGHRGIYYEHQNNLFPPLIFYEILPFFAVFLAVIRTYNKQGNKIIIVSLFFLPFPFNFSPLFQFFLSPIPRS